METYLAIVSKRDVRAYADKPVPDESLHRLLEAGRATGSARNRQNWHFIVIRNRELLDELAKTMSSPANLQACDVAIAIVMSGRTAAIDAGRVVQNIMLAAWSDGIGTCPNTPMQEEQAKELLNLPDESSVPTVLSLGYPDEPLRPKSSDPAAVLATIDRKPLTELTTWID